MPTTGMCSHGGCPNRKQVELGLSRRPLGESRPKVRKLLGGHHRASEGGKGERESRHLHSLSFHEPRFVRRLLPGNFLRLHRSKSHTDAQNIFFPPLGISFPASSQLLSRSSCPGFHRLWVVTTPRYCKELQKGQPVTFVRGGLCMVSLRQEPHQTPAPSSTQLSSPDHLDPFL